MRWVCEKLCPAYLRRLFCPCFRGSFFSSQENFFVISRFSLLEVHIHVSYPIYKNQSYSKSSSPRKLKNFLVPLLVALKIRDNYSKSVKISKMKIFLKILLRFRFFSRWSFQQCHISRILSASRKWFLVIEHHYQEWHSNPLGWARIQLKWFEYWLS